MFWLGVLAIAVGLVISIALHEVGHLLPAKKFGVRVPQYFVGFGPTIWSTRKGETEYGLKAIPLGGFVRLVGMFPPARQPDSEDDRAERRMRRRGLLGWARNVSDDAREASLEELQPGDDGRAFYQLSTPKKLAVMFGGPFVNLILSVLLFTVVFSVIGTPTATNTVATVVPCLAQTAGDDCAGVSDSPAAQAQFAPGDTIVSWNGAPIGDWTDITDAIAAGGTDPVQVVVLRDGVETPLTVTPALVEREVLDEQGNAELATLPYVGLSPTSVRQQQPLSVTGEAVMMQFTGTVSVVLTLPQRLASIAQTTFGGGERDPGVMGIIGVGRAAGDLTEASAPDGFLTQLQYLLLVLASLNMALFVFNLIPLPPLDGGHIAGALYEGARRQVARWRRRPNPGYADTAKLMPVTYAMVLLFLGMGLLLAVADIFNPVEII
ncbi:MAG: M50 family metallopeptidase [Beutenbergiaceae bacterium]